MALAEALGTSAAAFFEFDREERGERALRKRIDSLIANANAERLQVAYRVLRGLLAP